MSKWTSIASKSEIPNNDKLLIDINNTQIAIFNIEGKFYAIENICSHNNVTLFNEHSNLEDIVIEKKVVCQRHGAKFCLKTGQALCPPASDPIRTIPIRIKDGFIQTIEHDL